MTRLLEYFRDNKVNPMQVFEEADTDNMNGVTPGELETAFKKVLKKAPQLQIKKWVAHINYNHDDIIERNEYINALCAIYSKDQIAGFTGEYLKNKGKVLE